MKTKVAGWFLRSLAALMGSLLTVAAQTTIPPSQIPLAAVNTNVPGWLARTVAVPAGELDSRYRYSGWMANVANMELALGPVNTNTPGNLPSAGQVIDVNTGYYCTNAANFLGGNNPNIQTMLTEQFGIALGGCLVPADSNGFWTIDATGFGYAYINCDANGGGSSRIYFPGIPATTDPAMGENWKYFTTSFTGYMYLPAGAVTFNVTSADGFILFLSPSPNPNDAASLVPVGEFDAYRAPASTTMTANILQDGMYSVRLDYFKNTSDAVCTFSTTNAGGFDVLINDLSNPTALTAYPTPEFFPAPYAVQLSPAKDAANISPGSPPPVAVQIQDGTATTLDLKKPVTIKMNGTLLSSTVISNLGSATPSGLPLGYLTFISGQPPDGFTLPGATTIPIEVDFTDSAGNTTNITWKVATSGDLLTNDNATVNTSLRGFIAGGSARPSVKPVSTPPHLSSFNWWMA